ncbi:MAG: cell division protein ZapA [bacterium]
MSNQKSVPVTVKILEKEFRVSCPEDEKVGLEASADLLNERMRKVRDSGNVIGADRIAIIAALNLTHELLKQQSQHEALSTNLSHRVESMQDRIELALQDVQQMEM